MSHRALPAAPLILSALLFAGPAAAQSDAPLLQDSVDCPEPPEFTQVLTGEPLPWLMPEEEITPAVEALHCSGENAYSGDEEAIADGKGLYNPLCAGCHMPDGSGRMGPSLIDDTLKYERVATAHGEFEVIYGGAAGAMQAMGQRFTQDEILKIMAFVETLGAPAE
jgi:cytochrome c-L